MERVTATEYHRWLTQMEKELNERKLEHFLLAQLASEIACLPCLVWGKKPPDEIRDINKWIPKIVTREELKEIAEQRTRERMEQDAMTSEAVWMTQLGLLDGDGRVKTRRPPGMPEPPAEASTASNPGPIPPGPVSAPEPDGIPGGVVSRTRRRVYPSGS